MNKPVFIYTLHRSGSTYLKNIIDCSNEVKMLEDEVHFNHPIFKNTFKKYYNKYCKNDKKKYINFLNRIKNNDLRGSYWNIYNEKYDVFESKKYLNDKLTVWNSFDSILAQIINNSNKNRIGIKYPIHFVYFDAFIKKYPSSKNIFLVRDPRAIIASKFKSPTNKRLNTERSFKYEIGRLFTLIYFSIEYNIFTKNIFKHKEKIYIVKYEKLVIEKKR